MLDVIRKGQLFESTNEIRKYLLSTAVTTNVGENPLFESVLTLTRLEGDYYGVFEEGYNFVTQKDYYFEEILHKSEIVTKYRKFNVTL
jgi:hypothetical protein